MTTMTWVLCATLFVSYCFCIFTVCTRTFQKGYTGLGVAGFFLPALWLIGATLPAKRRSRYAVTHALQYLRQTTRDARRTGTSGALFAPEPRWWE
jgi:hypothetical protein